MDWGSNFLFVFFSDFSEDEDDFFDVLVLVDDDEPESSSLKKSWTLPDLDDFVGEDDEVVPERLDFFGTSSMDSSVTLAAFDPFFSKF